MANARAEKLAPYLDQPNVQTFLDLLSAAEGTTKYGYETMFGGSRLKNLDSHPHNTLPFTQTDGKKNRSSAAGRYQFIQKTWNGLEKSLGLTDFSARSQDLGALELMRRKGALDDVASGNFDAAVKKLGKTWASLPSSPYPQKTRTNEWVQNFIEAKGLEANFNKALAMAKNPVGAVKEELSHDPAPPSAMAMDVEGLVNPLASAGADLRTTNLAALTQPGANSFAPLAGGQDPFIQALTSPAWAQQVSAMQPTTRVNDPIAGAAEMEPWEQQLFAQAVDRDAGDARNEALANFFDEPATYNRELPKAIELALRSIVSNL